jgi:hypothetical protein
MPLVELETIRVYYEAHGRGSALDGRTTSHPSFEGQSR